MHPLTLFLLLSCLSLTNAAAQTSNVAARADSVYGRQLARVLRYPNEARQRGAVGQVYASFTVTSQGKLEQLVILNMSDVNNAFRQAVADALTKLPPQSPDLAGAYLLPVVFELEGRNGMKKPNDEERQQVRQRANQTVLSEVYVVGYID